MVITILSGSESIFQAVKCSYKEPLNGIRTAEFFVDGVDDITRTQLVEDTVVKIYRDNVLEFQGEITRQQSFLGGGIVVYCTGQETEFAEEDGPVDAGKHTKIYTSSDDNTIFADLVSNVSGWSSDVTGSTLTSIDSFRRSDSESNWNTIQRLIRYGKKDIYVDDASKTLFLTDRKGSATDTAVFNEGINVGSVKWSSIKAIPRVIVYGKGDGTDQIIGTSGSGTPVHKVYDRNVVGTTEANARAVAELARISAATKHYSFRPLTPNDNVVVGDQIELTAHSAGLNQVSLDIVSMSRGFEVSGNEFLEIEVSPNAHRETKKTVAQQMARSQMKSDVNKAAMQGNSNVLTFPAMINAKNGSPLRDVFQIPSSFIFDEAGNRRVTNFTIDYDVDPYRRSVGTATEQNEAPALDGTTATASHKHDATDTGNHTHPISATTSASSTLRNTFVSSFGITNTSGWGTGSAIISCAAPIISGTPDFAYVGVQISTQGSIGSGTIRITVTNESAQTIIDESYGADGDVYMWAFAPTTDSSINVNEGELLDLNIITLNPGATVNAAQMTITLEKNHTHSINTDTAEGAQANIGDSNKTPAVTGNTDSHNHGVSVGDDVTDSGSINATSVDIYLDFWNGSAWVNKTSVLATGVTIDTDVDISASGTYPDAAGFWRVRVDPDSASVDLVQAIVKLKHQLDN